MLRKRLVHIPFPQRKWMEFENGRPVTIYVKAEKGTYHRRSVLFFRDCCGYTIAHFNWKRHKVCAFTEEEQYNGRPVVYEQDIFGLPAKE